MSFELGDTTVNRIFESVDSNGNSVAIELRLGKPYMVSESNSSLKWRCPYQIIGIGMENVKEGQGIDAIDAMLVSLRFAEAHLKSYGRTQGKKITWLGEEDLGFYHSAQVELQDEDSGVLETGDSPFKKVFDEFFRGLESIDTPS